MLNILPNWHPIFVHFTVALLIVAAAMHVLSHFVSNINLKNQLATTARWNLWIGIGATLLTVAAGWYAFYTVSHDAPSHLAMTEHRNWAMVTGGIFRYRGLGILFAPSRQKQKLAVHGANGNRGKPAVIHRMARRRTGLPLWPGRDVHAQARRRGTCS